MSKVYIPQDYHTPLSVYEMQRAIEFIKSNFQVNLSNALNLRRVSALFALASSYRFYRKNIKLSIFFTCKSKNFLNVLSESFCT